MSFRQGARQFFERRAAPTPSVPTARDYVQTGLIAMWDGIENAGWNAHDQSATIWKDLIGGNDLTVNENVVWNNDSTLQTTKNPTATRENASVEWSFAEVVCDWSMVAGTSDNAVLFNSGSSRAATDIPFIYGNWADWYNSGRTKYFCRFLPNGRATKYAQIESLVADSSALMGTLAIDKTNQVVWRNSQRFAMVDTSQAILYNTANVIYVGSNNAVGERAYKGKFFCIRLYSRILTDSEIYANYSIDKVRFNLP